MIKSTMFHYVFLLLMLNVSSTAFKLPTNAAAPVVNLGYAQYEGFVDPSSNNTHFLGMRYTAPPLGDLRFRAPQPPLPASGIQQALAQPPRCLQASSGTSPTTPFRAQRRALPDLPDMEDCLFLNVYVPGNFGEQEALPVIAWFHGGGYISGSASGFDGTDIQNGDDFIREGGNGVVVVVIQYRLGLFGFLAGQKVKEDGALNAGLLDQQFALRWIQSHISKFGGDPAKVAIWGESAGAGSVLQHVIANDGKTTPPLFRAAITSSSFLPSQYAYDDVIPETLYSQTVSLANCSSSEDTLSCLRRVNSSVLENTNVELNSNGFFGTFTFVPVVDGTFITRRATLALREGKVNGEAVYSNTNAFEGSIFVDGSTASTVQLPIYVQQLFPKLDSQQSATAAAYYSGIGAPMNQAIAIMGEAIFICPTYYLLRAFDGRAYKSEFAIPPGQHGQDQAYYMPSQNANGVPAYNNTQFDTTFTDSLLNFARFLNPNNRGDPNNIAPLWDTWSDGKVEMLFNKTEANLPIVKTITTSQALLDRCMFWESVSVDTAQ